MVHIFLTSALIGGQWSASRSGRFTPQKCGPVIQWRLDGRQSRSGRRIICKKGQFPTVRSVPHVHKIREHNSGGHGLVFIEISNADNLDVSQKQLSKTTAFTVSRACEHGAIKQLFFLPGWLVCAWQRESTGCRIVSIQQWCCLDGYPTSFIQYSTPR
jgi:hypothetical protein